MNADPTSVANSQSIVIDLRNPGLAAFLAWLVPGAGHLYQGRLAKGLLYMICILSTWVFGMFIGGGKVVYASWRTGDMRLQYICQVGAGLPALPALVQALRTGGDHPKRPLWDGWMAPPLMHGQIIPADMFGEPYARAIQNDPGFAVLLSLPPSGRNPVPSEDELSRWNRELGGDYDLGTVFTMIAGLLNILVIWDAYAGPVESIASEDDPTDDKTGDGSPRPADGSKPKNL